MNVSIQERIISTDYVVQATSLEQYFLKQYFNEESWGNHSTYIINIGESGGFLQEKRQIHISCRWVVLNNINVLFWSPTTRLVDYDIIDKWFKNNCYPYRSDNNLPARCEASNFIQCTTYSRKSKIISTESYISAELNIKLK